MNLKYIVKALLNNSIWFKPVKKSLAKWVSTRRLELFQIHVINYNGFKFQAFLLVYDF